ncbi:uncharacterized protein LOC125841922, partial [Solanum stenotomum]|uniref:uncharacterized protein LOC125841922 n=1 Tax=Solanum stenotomum TaxID=172797 RepID=UPI0020D09C8A
TWKSSGLIAIWHACLSFRPPLSAKCLQPPSYLFQLPYPPLQLLLPPPTYSNLNHNHQLIVSLYGRRRKSISAYRFNCSISRSFRRISYPSPIRIRPLSPVMEWQDCTIKMEVDVPISVAYKCYSDSEAIPEWMPFISTVKILEDKPNLSRWSLK